MRKAVKEENKDDLSVFLGSDRGVSGGEQGLFSAKCLRSRHLGNGSPRSRSFLFSLEADWELWENMEIGEKG